MRKLALLATICVSLSLPLCTVIAVRATPRINSIYDVQLGMSIADVISALQGKYTLKTSDEENDMREVIVTGGPDPRVYYEIDTLKGKVASIWTNDTKSYSGDAFVAGTELFDALYASGRPRRDGPGEALGVRNLDVRVELQKPTSDSSLKTLIFNLPGQDFRFDFRNGSLLVERVRSLDESAFEKLFGSSQ